MSAIQSVEPTDPVLAATGHAISSLTEDTLSWYDIHLSSTDQEIMRTKIIINKIRPVIVNGGS